MALKYNVGDKITISGTVIEAVENEDYGVRYQVKIKANDKKAVLSFEEDEIDEPQNS